MPDLPGELTKLFTDGFNQVNTKLDAVLEKLSDHGARIKATEEAHVAHRGDFNEFKSEMKAQIELLKASNNEVALWRAGLAGEQRSRSLVSGGVWTVVLLVLGAALTGYFTVKVDAATHAAAAEAVRSSKP